MTCPVADAHVDVLWRMLRGATFRDASQLQASAENLLRGGVATQVFALFVDPSWSSATQLESVLRCTDTFYESVVQEQPFQAVRNRRELAVARSHGQVACLLSLEGAGCLNGRLELLRTLYRLGVRGVGLTWNGPNELADGCRVARGAGLTEAGIAAVREMQKLDMWVDIAHLADAGVRDVFRVTDGPVMASHANSRSVCQHPRNLTDDVVREITTRQGWIGLVFEASFVDPGNEATVSHVIRHLDHMLELGAEDCVGFGSDFDGASNPVLGLANAADYARFAEQLADRYGEPLARKVLFGNFERFLNDVLPDDSAIIAEG